MSEDDIGSKGWKVPNQSLYRKGGEADITNVTVEKLQNAAERGIRIDLTESRPGKVKAQINKIAIKGDDEP